MIELFPPSSRQTLIQSPKTPTTIATVTAIIIFPDAPRNFYGPLSIDRLMITFCGKAASEMIWILLTASGNLIDSCE